MDIDRLNGIISDMPRVGRPNVKTMSKWLKIVNTLENYKWRESIDGLKSWVSPHGRWIVLWDNSYTGSSLALSILKVHVVNAETLPDEECDSYINMMREKYPNMKYILGTGVRLDDLVDHIDSVIKGATIVDRGGFINMEGTMRKGKDEYDHRQVQLARIELRERFDIRSLLSEAYSERTKTSALNAAKDMPKTGYMHISDFEDDGNYFKVYLIDKDNQNIKQQISSKDIRTPAGRLAATNSDETQKMLADPKRYYIISEFNMTWRGGGQRPDPKDPESYYPSAHHGGFDNILDAIKHHIDKDSKRSQALNDLVTAGQIQ